MSRTVPGARARCNNIRMHARSARCAALAIRRQSGHAPGAGEQETLPCLLAGSAPTHRIEKSRNGESAAWQRGMARTARHAPHRERRPGQSPWRGARARGGRPSAFRLLQRWRLFRRAGGFMSLKNKARAASPKKVKLVTGHFFFFLAVTSHNGRARLPRRHIPVGAARAVPVDCLCPLRTPPHNRVASRAALKRHLPSRSSRSQTALRHRVQVCAQGDHHEGVL